MVQEVGCMRIVLDRQVDIKWEPLQKEERTHHECLSSANAKIKRAGELIVKFT